jgi:hypothetical protein
METKTKEKKSTECTICKFHSSTGNYINSASSRETVFDDAGAPIAIPLCHHHAVELFKLGQKRFLLNQYNTAKDLIGYDEDRLLGLIFKTAQRNFDKIF